MEKIKLKLNSVKSFYFIYKYQICFFALVLFTLITRGYRLGTLPCGLNPDEVSIGYDAWAISNYGIDRNGISLPVNLIAWGSGQNALFAYLLMPFIKIFGLNIFSIRLINFIFGCLSVVLSYFIVKPFLGQKLALSAMGMLAISPWHIMLCRWGLESNLFPLIFTLGVFLLVKGLDNKMYLPFATAVFALSLYSYGAAYVVVPLFMISFSAYVILKTDVGVKYIAISATLFTVIAIPIGLCFLTNQFEWGDIEILGFTAPQVSGIGERWGELTAFNPLTAFKDAFNILVRQTDFTISNQIDGYGYMYLFSLPLTVMGVIKLLKERSHLTFLLFSWFLCSVPLFFTYIESNMNRVNIIFIPVIITTGIGLGCIFKHLKVFILSLCCYAIAFYGFAHYYYGEYNSVLAPFFYSSIEEALPKAIDMREEGEVIYVTETLNKPYIYALFFSKTSPEVFVETAEIPNPDAQFYDVDYFEGFVCSTKAAKEGKEGIYVMPNSEALEYIESASEHYVYELYTVFRLE